MLCYKFVEDSKLILFVHEIKVLLPRLLFATSSSNNFNLISVLHMLPQYQQVLI